MYGERTILDKHIASYKNYHLVYSLGQCFRHYRQEWWDKSKDKVANLEAIAVTLMRKNDDLDWFTNTSN